MIIDVDVGTKITGNAEVNNYYNVYLFNQPIEADM